MTMAEKILSRQGVFTAKDIYEADRGSTNVITIYRLLAKLVLQGRIRVAKEGKPRSYEVSRPEEVSQSVDPRVRALALLAKGSLSYREGQFLGGIVCADRPLSQKQEAWFAEISSRFVSKNAEVAS